MPKEKKHEDDPQKKDEDNSPAPKSTVFKVTLDTSSVVNTPESITEFAHLVLQKLHSFAEKRNYKLDPALQDEGYSFPLEPPRFVTFLDTPNDDLKTHFFLLRHRWGKDGGSDLEDLTFKKRDSAVPTTDLLNQMTPVAEQKHETKVKMQWVAGKSAPAYGLYTQFKTTDTVGAVTNKAGINLVDGFPLEKLTALFPVLGSLGLDGNSVVSTNGLTVLQQEVALPELTFNYGGHEMKVEPSLIIWFEDGKDQPAFTGELTWDIKWKKSHAQHHFQKELLFNGFLEDSLDGLLSTETKASAAYHLMHHDAS